MENLESVYISETKELLELLENAILELEENPDKEELIEEIFRALHTMKGNSNMFGYDKIGAITHNLESSFDLIRNKARKVHKKLIDVTFASIDIIKELLETKDLSGAQLSKYNALINELGQLSNSENLQRVDIRDTDHHTEILTTWIIRLIPQRDLLKNGSNPLFLFDELAGLGKCRFITHDEKLHDYLNSEPTDCFLWWDIIIETYSHKSELEEVFMFVEDKCQLEVVELCNGPMLETPLMEKVLNELDGSGEDLIAIAGKIGKRILNGVEQEYRQTRNNSSNESSSSTLRVDVDKIDKLISLVSELISTQASLSLRADWVNDPSLFTISETFEKLSKQLRDVTHNICLVPLSVIVVRLRRLVRELSEEQGKGINFLNIGADTELDKNMIDKLTELLMHIFRNSIDHGLETAIERKAAGKAETGVLELKSYYSGNQVCIEISDDGRGLDLEKIRQKAIEKELISTDENLSSQELRKLIFTPGFSTAKTVTDLSGRGVGLDVVMKNIRSMRGELAVDSEKGKGTKFLIKLPLTMSMIDGLLIRIGETKFILPLSSVQYCGLITKADLAKEFNNTIIFNEVKTPIVNLRKEFNILQASEELMQLVIVKFEQSIVGFPVDEIIGEYQAVLKPLGQMYTKSDFVSGATILGDGTLALVLDPGKVIQDFENGIIKAKDKVSA